MNERIKELENKCWEDCDNGIIGFDREKFAELLVKECAELMEEQHTWMTNVSASKMIRMHFGVE